MPFGNRALEKTSNRKGNMGINKLDTNYDNRCIKIGVQLWYVRKDSIHYGVGVVKPPGRSPLDTCIELFKP